MKKTLIQLSAISLLTFFLSWSADKVMSLWLLQISFPETIATKDFHWEDFVFKIRPAATPEKKIVLVNVANGTRGELSRLFEAINRENPRVVGVLVLFNCPDGRDPLNCPQLLDTAGNRLLGEALRKTDQLVMNTFLRSTRASLASDAEEVDSIEYSDPDFIRNAQPGFDNLPQSTYQNIKESRTFFPQYTIQDTVRNSFAIAVSSLYDSSVTQKFLRRRNQEEIIDFGGNVSPYRYIFGSKTIEKEKYFESVDYDSLMTGHFAKGIFKDKIVLVGFLGDYLDDPTYGDKFFTPLNPTLAGRSNPDMLGLVVHANIISMILNANYVNQLSDFWEGVVLIVIVLLNGWLFIKLHRRNSVWYDSLCFIIPVVEIVIISMLRIELLASYNFRLDLQNVIYLIAFVSFATNLYFGPLASLGRMIRSRLRPPLR